MPQPNDDNHDMTLTEHLRDILANILTPMERTNTPLPEESEEQRQKEQKQASGVQIPLMTPSPPNPFYTGTQTPKVKASKPLNFVKQDESAVQVEGNMELRLNDEEGLIVVNKKLNKVIFHIDPQGRQVETPYDAPEEDVL